MNRRIPAQGVQLHEKKWDRDTPAYYSIYYPTSGWDANISKNRFFRSHVMILSKGTTSIEVPHMSARGLGEGLGASITMVSAGPIEVERWMYWSQTLRSLRFA